MSKKILPIVTLLGASALIVGISLPANTEKKESISNHIDAFEQNVSNYISANTKLSTTALNKYALSLQEKLEDIPSIDNLSSLSDSSSQDLDETDKSLTDIEDIENLEDNNSEDIVDNKEIDEYENDETNLPLEEIEDVKQISTLYSLSTDIETSCDEFCELKEEISNAIIETQNLIDKVQKKEIELSNEQRLLITEQAQQLKSLGRQLSSITTELSFNLSDLSQLMSTDNQDIDNLSLKYLVVLDNLVNGNEMLQSGLSSLNLINQMFNMNSRGAMPNNHGRILYGFQHNNNPPVIKDYYIDENGNVIENNAQEDTNSENNDAVSNEKTNVDTYQNSNLRTNLDTYNNTNLNRNIDSFFNTALLDNEFMYGNGYGYGMNGYNNPYVRNYPNHGINTSNGVAENNNTQNNVENNKTSMQEKKEKKRFKLEKNIDTFKDENEPDIKTKLGNIKNSIASFFGKSKLDLNDKIDNPIYRYKASNKDKNS